MAGWGWGSVQPAAMKQKQQPRRTIEASQGYQKCQNKGRFVNNKRWQPKQPDVPIEQDRSCLYPIIMWGLCTSCYLGSASFKSQAWIVTRGGKSWAPLTPHPAALWPMAAAATAARQWQQRLRRRQRRQQRAMATGIQGARNRRCPMHIVTFYNIKLLW